MNKKKILIICGILVGIILIILMVVLLTGGGNNFFVTVDEDARKFKNEYEQLNNETLESGEKYPEVDIPSDNMIKYTTVDELLNIFNTAGDGVIYFGYSTCLYCRNAIQVLMDTAYESELDVIHYMDIEDVWDVKELDENNKVVTVKEPDDRYYELLDVLGDELVTDYILESADGEEIATGDKRLEVPLVIFITNGNVSGYNKGTLFSQEDPLVEMDESQIQGLSEIYYYGIRDVVNSKKSKGLLN